jgi:non-ribosomal peptide synthetase component E (peptide arylation enzyme)
MLPGCVPFPAEVAGRYRQEGYWAGGPGRAAPARP